MSGKSRRQIVTLHEGTTQVHADELVILSIDDGVLPHRDAVGSGRARCGHETAAEGRGPSLALRALSCGVVASRELVESDSREPLGGASPPLAWSVAVWLRLVPRARG
jgi:hypothetical protein